MPRKNLYVSEADLPIFERAEELAGGESLSAIVADALKKYVEIKESEISELEFYEFKSGGKTIAFHGLLLATETIKTGQTSSRDDRGEDWYIYQSKAGKIIIRLTYWTRWEGEKGHTEYVVLNSLPDYEDEVFDDVAVPSDTLEEAYASLGKEKRVYIE